MQVGVLGSFGAYHIGPEALLLADPDNDDPDHPTPTYPRSPLIRLDSQFYHGTVFVKYNNGRFFMNSEAAWLYWTDRFQPNEWQGQNVDADNVAVYMPYTRHIETVAGHVGDGRVRRPDQGEPHRRLVPGPDRRAGRYIDRQSAAFVWHPTYDTRLGNFSVFRPYSYLFWYDYGFWVERHNLSGDGYIRDAFVLAGRVDYAVASNLNVFGSCFWAQTSPWIPVGSFEAEFLPQP